MVVADQFAKRGIISNGAREKALAIIDSGSDLANLSKLGMKPKDLSKRQRMHADLRARLTMKPEAAKSRPVLKKPQPFLMEVGEAFVYPTSGGECINSYYASKDKIPGWSQDGWGAAIMVERGRVFDFLVWYRPLVISYARTEKPSLTQLRLEPLWVFKGPGTCSKVHFKRLELEKVGDVEIDTDKLARSFPDRGSGRWAAVNDLSITNALSVGPKVPAVLMPAPGQPLNFSRGRPFRTIASLDEILSG